MPSCAHQWLASQPHGSGVIVLVCQVCGREEQRPAAPPVWKRGTAAWIADKSRTKRGWGI